MTIDLPECQERRRGKNNVVRVFLKASPAFGRNAFTPKKNTDNMLFLPVVIDIREGLWSKTGGVGGAGRCQNRPFFGREAGGGGVVLTFGKVNCHGPPGEGEGRGGGGGRVGAKIDFFSGDGWRGSDLKDSKTLHFDPKDWLHPPDRPKWD